jgi:hypothetical protein
MDNREQLYHLISAEFAEEIKKTWASEESMAAAYASLCHGEKVKFDRTIHAGNLVKQLLESMWSRHITDFKPIHYDITEILKDLIHILDYNVFTQVYQNLTPFVLRYDSVAAAKAVEEAMAALTPDMKKDLESPKLKYAAEDKVPDPMLRSHFNTVVAAKKISSLSPYASFRISPFTATPAFADSANFSGFSIYLDQFLEAPAMHVAVLRWTAAEAKDLSIPTAPGEEAHIMFPDAGTFISKSGGPILAQTMFARKMMRDLLLKFGFSYIVYPRLFSLTVVFPTNVENGLEELNKFFKEYV